MTPESLAPLLYAAHCESRGWQDEHGSLRPWSAIKDIERTHWSMVAREAITRWNLPPDALAAINAALTPGSRSKCA